ncbi:hypothetical protein KQI63_03985 [bacterium]|nr:hypothetical protein [bacterium]
MSWTEPDTIRVHLQALSIDALTVRFLPVQIQGSGAVQLPHASLASGQVKLYRIEATYPTGPVEVTLSGSGWVSLGLGPLHPKSVVLAKGWTLEDRYLEGIDYAVDEAAGSVKRLDGGTISPGATVKVWCLPLVELTEATDFEVDYTAGTIKRLPAGVLPDPTWVLVSYSTTAVGASDELIGQAISEAEAKILDRLKEGYDETSTDSGLGIGTTELTLSLLCDDMALRALAAVGDVSADDRARRFLDLSRRYEERAISTLSKFLRLPLPAVSTRQSNVPSPSGW